MRWVRDRLLSVFVLFVFYCSICWFRSSPSLPSIDKIIEAGYRILKTRDFYENVQYTMKIVFIGVGVSFIGGLIISVSCTASKVLNKSIMPIINATKNIPSIALFPIFIVLMGIGDLPRIFVIVWNSAYPIITSSISAIQSIDKDIIDAAQNTGATKWQIYRYIKMPLSLVRILEGFKIAISNGFVAIVVAEMLGATKGLGYMIVWSTNAFQYPQMYFYIFVIAIIGFAINLVIEYVIKLIDRRIYS